MLAKYLAHQLRQPTGFVGKMVAQVMEATNKAAYHDALKSIDLPPGSHLFEIGYGPGDGLALLRKRSPGCRLSGIDFSSLMYESARKRLGRQGEVELSCGDFLAAPLPHHAYSHVLCVNVVYFWPRLDEPFKKIASMLRPDGALVIFMRDEAYLERKKLLQSGVFNRHAFSDVIRALGDAGFDAVQRDGDRGVVIHAKKLPAVARQDR